ncbi:unnamed protein product [Leptidea sinapis]|uniref:Uncharacterized protein n=1 Tax=Leptidea sinapis TaxID=189913 RepID=A0A5E4QLR5_9NEOP|nr:unnamed protein product [Leptidea sinapis]
MALRRDVASLCDIIPTIWMCGGPPQCGFQGAFFHVLQSCGMSFLVRCRHALVIPLVLQENVGGGDHLTPGDPYARLSSYSIKKNNQCLIRRQPASCGLATEAEELDDAED